MRVFKSPLSFLLLAALALLLVYQNALDNSFHYDDFHSITANPHIRDLANIPAFFQRPEMFSGMSERAMYRPLVLVSYALNYWLGGLDVQGFHLFNLGLHGLCVLLVYLLGRTLGGGERLAALGALLFALHPVNAEVVNYISSRSESLAACFYLAALVAYLQGRKRYLQGEKIAVLCGVLSLLAYAGGLLCKSIAITLPAALLIYELLRSEKGHRSAGLTFMLPCHLGYWALTVAYLLLVRSWVEGALGTPVRSAAEQFATQVKAAIYYLQLLVLPVRLSVEHPLDVSSSLGAAPVVLALALLATSGTVLWLWRSKPALLLAAWTVLAVLPASVVPLNVLVNEHRLYLPLALGCACLGLVGCVPQRWSRWQISAGGLVLLLGILSHQRNPVWKDEFSLWSDAVSKAPGQYRAHMHLGGALEQQGRLADALQSYENAARIAPAVVEVHYNRGNALRALGRTEEAIKAYRASLELNPDHTETQINLAELYRRLNQVGLAEELLLKARDLKPGAADIQRRLGTVYKVQGRIQKAEVAYLRALELDPALAEACYNLANLYAADGKDQQAIALYRRALNLQKDHANALNNLGWLLHDRGTYEKAAQVFARGLRQAPDKVFFYYGLARSQEELGQSPKAALNYREYLRRAGQVRPEVAEDIRQRLHQLGSGAP